MSIYAVGIALGVPTFSFRKVAIKNSIQLIENIEFLFTSNFLSACRPLSFFTHGRSDAVAAKRRLKPKPLLMFKINALCVSTWRQRRTTLSLKTYTRAG
ncbi:hypothetical protein ACI2JW_19340 [Serratia ureilytica]|uniref:hypothetical protein n=1 Tax=Serratia TaxID=613 RepID=UPI00384AEC29